MCSSDDVVLFVHVYMCFGVEDNGMASMDEFSTVPCARVAKGDAGDVRASPSNVRAILSKQWPLFCNVWLKKEVTSVAK